MHSVLGWLVGQTPGLLAELHSFMSCCCSTHIAANTGQTPLSANPHPGLLTAAMSKRLRLSASVRGVSHMFTSKQWSCGNLRRMHTRPQRAGQGRVGHQMLHDTYAQQTPSKSAYACARGSPKPFSPSPATFTAGPTHPPTHPPTHLPSQPWVYRWAPQRRRVRSLQRQWDPLAPTATSSRHKGRSPRLMARWRHQSS